MNVGLPGSGIGGMFYLLSALCMPVASFYRQLRSRPAGWLMALRQAATALGIVAGLTMTASLAGFLLAETPLATWITRSVTEGDRIPSIFRAVSVIISVGTLAFLVVVVWVAAFLVHGPAALRGSRPATQPVTVRPARVARASSGR